MTQNHKNPETPLAKKPRTAEEWLALGDELAGKPKQCKDCKWYVPEPKNRHQRYCILWGSDANRECHEHNFFTYRIVWYKRWMFWLKN